MVVIRLARTGSKKKPFYHIVAADKRTARDGRYIERLGYFNPVACGKAIRLKIERERVEYWISQGAQPSDRAAHLIKEFDRDLAVIAKAEADKPKKTAPKKPPAEKAEEPKKEAVVDAAQTEELVKTDAPAETATAEETAAE